MTDAGLILSFGELLIDFVPTFGGLSLADSPAFKKAPGGTLQLVGDDEFGHNLVEILKNNKVDTSAMKFDSNARTCLAFVTLKDDGEREFMFYRNPSADMLLTPEELDDELIKKASIIHYNTISLITEPCRSSHLSLIEKAKNAGIFISYDPNLRMPLWPSAEAAREGLLSIWKHADMIKVSEQELEFLSNGGDGFSDEAALSLNLKLLLVTEGYRGCRYYTKNFLGRVDAVKVQAVDTTGAGDAFCAGLLTQLVNDMAILEDENRLRDALRFANACGAITTTERGAIPALPNRDSVLRLIDELPKSNMPSRTKSWQNIHQWRLQNVETAQAEPQT